MRISLATIFLSLLFFISSPMSYVSTRMYSKVAPAKVKDSSVITIPFSINIGKITDEYKQDKYIKIDHFYNKHIGTAGFSGGFIVAKNGTILYEDYQGYSNLKNKTENNANTALHLASVSKVITATAVLKLVNDGKLSLDQKVKTILPDFPYEHITIRTLLNHRSGLQHYSRYSALLKKKWNTKKVLNNQDVLDLINKHKIRLLSATNTRFEYCNTNYVMLALVIEKITQMKFQDAMQQIVFQPLGMKNTFVFNYSTDRDTVSKSYRGKNVACGWDQYDALYGDKNIYSTPRDLVKFDLATYSPTYIKPEIIQEAYVGYSPNKKLMKNYGLGIRMKEWETGQKLLYHNGWWHGSTTSYVTLKKDTVAIIALSNKYSTKPYQSLKLSSYFGDFPYAVEDVEATE